MLERLKKLPKVISKIFSRDKIVGKLIYHDSNNALEMDAPQPELVQEYITTHPVYQFEGKERYEQNGMINVYYAKINRDQFEELSTNGIIRINVVYNVDKWELADGECRVLTLTNRIINLLDKKQLETSGSLEFYSLDELILSKTLVGYALLFGVNDGNSEVTNNY